MEFTNKVAVITGASRGIGTAIARELARLGCNLILIARDLERLKKIAEELAPTGVKVAVYRCDVSSSEEVNKTFGDIKARYGHLDFLINNAGVNSSKPLLLLTEQDFDLEVAVNLKGTYLCIMAAYPLIKKGGVIVNIGSVRGRMGSENTSIAYAAAKAGVTNMTKSFALQLAPYDIRVNEVAPKSVYPTAMNTHWDPQKVEDVTHESPLKRLPTPEDVAMSVVFLLSDKAYHITGHTLDINDGYWMN